MPASRVARNATYYAAHKAEIVAYRAERKVERAANAAAYYIEHRAERAAYYAAHKAERVAYRAAHKAEKAAYDAAYDKAHPEVARAATKRMREKYPEKEAARYAVKKEVRAGRWPPASGQVCEICGEAQAQEYHHHLGYAPEHWLHAQAVCVECHTNLHRGR